MITRWVPAKSCRASPQISIVVGSYNMRRELPRTIRSLSPAMQNGVGGIPYEVLVVDNGSTLPFDESECRRWQPNLKILRFASGNPSPVAALNEGIRQAEGELIGLMIDGARLTSPGIVSLASMADRLSDRAVILTLGFHLGPEFQSKSVLSGYDQDVEDRLLDEARWTEDGYRLFNISVFARSSRRGWFGSLNESNAIFMRRGLWDELGGLDERFQSPGGGLVNLDTLSRAVQLPGVVVITLLGEGTFHQVHGGVATNALHSPGDIFQAEYQRIRGRKFKAAHYQSLYFGVVPPESLASIGGSVPLASATLAK